MYPTVSVVDVTSAEGANGAPDGERLVVWHVQTAPDAAADALSGAWIFGDSTGHSIAQAADVVSGTVMLPTPGAVIMRCWSSWASISRSAWML